MVLFKTPNTIFKIYKYNRHKCIMKANKTSTECIFIVYTRTLTYYAPASGSGQGGSSTANIIMSINIRTLRPKSSREDSLRTERDITRMQIRGSLS